MNQTSPMNKPEENALPADTGQAVQRLVRISEQLLELLEKETQALVQDDMVLFALLQQEKEMLSRHYARASEEFRGRLEEFRGIDRVHLDRLESLQNRLSEKTQSNNVVAQKMYSRAQEKTHSTLITAQELGQKAPLNLNGHANQQQGAE